MKKAERGTRKAELGRQSDGGAVGRSGGQTVGRSGGVTAGLSNCRTAGLALCLALAAVSVQGVTYTLNAKIITDTNDVVVHAVAADTATTATTATTAASASQSTGAVATARAYTDNATNGLINLAGATGAAQNVASAYVLKAGDTMTGTLGFGTYGSDYWGVIQSWDQEPATDSRAFAFVVGSGIGAKMILMPAFDSIESPATMAMNADITAALVTYATTNALNIAQTNATDPVARTNWIAAVEASTNPVPGWIAVAQTNATDPVARAGVATNTVTATNALAIANAAQPASQAGWFGTCRWFDNGGVPALDWVHNLTQGSATFHSAPGNGVTKFFLFEDGNASTATAIATAGTITNLLFWAGPAASQTATNANTVYLTW